ncbi:hypothetical protein [Marinobacter sp. LN3S78]|uniref:hypothetical protein n=1 Tax=Marinobacter sp. LN3S78 TaxID=3382300 RepID=UPI00387AB17B
MKTLSGTDTSIEYWVAELNGYLSAVSHLNDAVGYRHGFYSDLIYLGDLCPLAAINQYVGKSCDDIVEIDLKVEAQQIEKYVLNNFSRGNGVAEDQRTNFVLEQFRWHIQEYVSLAAGYGPEKNRWLLREESERSSKSSLFVQIDGYILVMVFHWRIDDVDL